MYVPPLSRPYFLPDKEWLAKVRQPEAFIQTDILSNVETGFRTIGYPSSTTEFYEPPFFIIFKTPPTVRSNYLIFNNFFKPNSECSILAMINFNEEQNAFVSDFAPGIDLPYSNFLTLNKTLEFRIVDSNNKTVDLRDNCKLYIKLILT